MLKNHLKIAFRNLLKRPFYTTINVLGLAIGMACTLLITIYVLHELSYDRFHEKADRIYRLATHLEVGESGFIGAKVSPAVAGPFKAEVPEVDMVVRMNQYDNKVFRKGETVIKEDKVLAADPDFFRMFSFPLVTGDPAQVLQEPNSVVMTEAAARKYFQEEDPIGQTVVIDSQAFQITGIMKPVPQASHFHFDIIYSFLSDPASKVANWGDIHASTYFLLHKGGAIEKVNAAFDPLLKKYLREYDMFQSMGYVIEMFTQPITSIHLHSHILGEFEPNGNIKYLYIFGAIALFILLIACINFMNLSTARSADRAKEVGVRKTMGSTRSTLIRQFLAESLLLSLCSMLLALGLAELLRIPLGKDIHLPLLAPWFIPSVLLLGIIVGVLAGSYPAFYLTKFRPAEVLKGQLTLGSKNTWLRNSLVVFQFVVSIVLIVCTLMVYQQLQFIRNKDLGFDKENVIVLNGGQFLGNNKDAFYNALMQSSEIQAVSFTDVSPLAGYDGTGFKPATESDSTSGSTFRDEDAVVLNNLMVSYDYLPTMSIRLKEGRNFSREIAADSAYHALILNEQAVRAMGLVNPIGHIVLVGGTYKARVIGVAEDFHYMSLHSAVEPLVMILADKPNFVEVKVASRDLPQTLALLETQWNLHTNGTPFDYSFLDEDFDALFRADQQVGMIFGGFTALAIFIACLGLLALAAFMAEQRTKEIGIRKVLGASVENIVLLLSKDFTKLTLIAFIIAVPLSYFAIQRWLDDFAYKSPVSLWTFLLAGAAVILIALLTVSYQSIKAATANPVDSLKNE